MIKYKDRPDVPAPILKALMSDEYEDSLAEHFSGLPNGITRSISTTTLSRSPRQRILFNRHSHKVELDPMDKFWAMFGRTIHSILEENRGPGDRVEERKGILLKGGVYVHGAADLYNHDAQRIDDYKFTKAESASYDHSDHVAQLNVLGYIWRVNGFPVSQLRNVYLYRNWESRKVKEGTPYPKEQVQVVEVPMWDDAQCLEFIESRVFDHFGAEYLKDEELPFCTDKERWMREPIYKVYKLEKDGSRQKMAKATCHSMAEAQDEVSILVNNSLLSISEKNSKLKKPKPEAELPAPDEFTIVELKARPIRCAFCEIRSFCSQHLAEQIEETMEAELPDLE